MVPSRSKINDLPDSIKTELDRRLIDGGFAGYQELADWLEAQGYPISKSAIHRHGQNFEEKIGALKIVREQAIAIAEAVPDDQNAVGDALITLAQERAFTVLLNLTQKDLEGIELPALFRSVAQLNNSSVKVKEFTARVRQRAEAAQQQAEEILKKDGGYSAETAALIRAQFLGITQ